MTLSMTPAPHDQEHTDLTGLLEYISYILITKQWHLSVAESCTAGALANTLTHLEGASRWFAGGIIAYTEDSKMNLLDVFPETLDAHTACSLEVAEQMAIGCQKQLDSDVAIAITGEAGPISQTGVPGGTVCFAWLIDDTIYCETHQFEGNRHAVRTASVQHAIQRLKDFLEHTLSHLVQH